ncbi:TRAFAC clade GTPase domain-containing protein [Rhodococcus sp. ACT016]|uniref:TRAFAC clade GTPase domain-containing protein n=1 Tax=Rhodococcus sp. ACT016 TaxID=3134808 RepID=UPI003D267234
MTKCPRCFVTLTPDQYAWTRTVPDAMEVDEIASTYHGSAVRSGPVIELKRPNDAEEDWAPPSGHAEKEAGGDVAEVCPECHYRLPAGWRDAQATCVAMAGARATGKTVYVAVLVKSLHLLGERMSQMVEPATAETEDSYRENYERPLYEERGILEPTPAAHTGNPYQREPLIFSIGIWNGVRQYLVIRDVAGEDLEDPKNVGATSMQFFSRADGVVFMFDPLRVDSVRDQLHDLVPAQERVGGDPKSVLRTVLSIIGTGTPNLAVVLSKFDALQALAHVDGSEWSEIMSQRGAAYSRDPSLQNEPYNEQDGRLLHEEVRSLLDKLEAKAMAMAVEQPHTGVALGSRYFAVSALGESPVGDRLHESGISPFRCLDPVRWVLAQQGVWV